MRQFRTSRRRVRDAVTRSATKKCFSYRGPRRKGSSEPSVNRSHLVEHAPDQHPERLAVAAGIVALAFDIAWARKPRGAGGSGASTGSQLTCGSPAPSPNSYGCRLLGY